LVAGWGAAVLRPYKEVGKAGAGGSGEKPAGVMAREKSGHGDAVPLRRGWQHAGTAKSRWCWRRRAGGAREEKADSSQTRLGMTNVLGHDKSAMARQKYDGTTNVRGHGTQRKSKFLPLAGEPRKPGSE